MVIHQITRNGTLASLTQFYGKMWVGFWLDTKTHFTTDISENGHLEDRNLFCKTVL